VNETDEESLPCSDKLAFDTKDQAEAVAIAADWQHGSSLKTYRCSHCKLWHLSSDHGSG
jgi:hypothetical protein